MVGAAQLTLFFSPRLFVVVTCVAWSVVEGSTNAPIPLTETTKKRPILYPTSKKLPVSPWIPHWSRTAHDLIVPEREREY